MEQKRCLYMDVLRVCAFACVVLLHSVSPYIMSNDLLGTFAWKFSVAMNAAARMGVPLFLMLTGALLLGRGDNAPTLGRFYRRRLPRVLVPLLCWDILYELFSVLYGSAEWSFSGFFAGVICNGTYYHLWYLYQLLGIYLILPFLDRICRSSSLWEVAVLMVIAAFPGAIRPFLNIRLSVSIFLFEPLLEGYLGYVLLGYLLSRVRLTKLLGVLGALLLAAGLFFSISDNISASLKGGTVALPANGGYALNNYVSAGGFFLLVRALLENVKAPAKLGRVLAGLSAATYAAYGVHAGVLAVIQKVQVSWPFSVIMLATAAVTMVISISIALLLRLIKPARFLFG